MSARDVVVATNTPIVDRFAMHTKQAAYRSYALALQLQASWPSALWWDTGDPYHYVRGGGEAALVIVGGEDHKTGQARDPEQTTSYLAGRKVTRQLAWFAEHPERALKQARGVFTRRVKSAA